MEPNEGWFSLHRCAGHRCSPTLTLALVHPALVLHLCIHSSSGSVKVKVAASQSVSGIMSHCTALSFSLICRAWARFESLISSGSASQAPPRGWTVTTAPQPSAPRHIVHAWRGRAPHACHQVPAPAGRCALATPPCAASRVRAIFFTLCSRVARPVSCIRRTTMECVLPDAMMQS